MSSVGQSAKTAAALAVGVGLGFFAKKVMDKLQESEAKRRKLAKTGGRVPIYVMMPLDTVSEDGNSVKDVKTRKAWLAALKKSKVRGIMVDVWWGLCETKPGQYNFTGYLELCKLAKEIGLEVQAVMSFHQCGGNVGDSLTIPIPSWALDIAQSSGMLYVAGGNKTSKDCLSLSADLEVVFPGPKGKRSALDLYQDFMAAFAEKFQSYIRHGTIVEIQVGMGPCGELRYPSYMMAEGWNYPGVGLICAHDKGMQKLGFKVPKGEPADQNGNPADAQMFSSPSDQDKAFLVKYADALLEHGKQILLRAAKAFPRNDDGHQLAFSVKVSGIHWHTLHRSRAAEACAGYVPRAGGGGHYVEIARMLADVAKEVKRPIYFNFTCLEMRNGCEGCDSAPEDLIAEVRRACIAHDVPLCGENALQFGLPEDPAALEQIMKQARGWGKGRDKMHSITLLRLDEGFVRPSSLDVLHDWISSL